MRQPRPIFASHMSEIVITRSDRDMLAMGECLCSIPFAEKLPGCCIPDRGTRCVPLILQAAECAVQGLLGVLEKAPVWEHRVLIRLFSACSGWPQSVMGKMSRASEMPSTAEKCAKRNLGSMVHSHTWLTRDREHAH